MDRLANALSLPSDQFFSQFGFSKPGSDDLVIMSCRTNTRAAWAATLAQDAGLVRCVVYQQGVYGWRIDPAVKVYRGYKLYDPPPEPEPFLLEQPDFGSGTAELAALGVVGIAY